MRSLLFLSHRLPYPPEKGEKIRAWHMLERLARTHRVHLGCFIDDPADWDHVPFLRSICAEVACFDFSSRRQKVKAVLGLRPGRALTIGYFRDARLQRWVNETVGSHAIEDAFVFSSSMAPYVMGRELPGSRVLDMVDVDSEKWAAYAAHLRWPKRAIWAREAQTLLAFERQAASAFDRTLFVSRDEWLRFTSLAPECTTHTDWLENGVDAGRFSTDFVCDDPYGTAAPRIVFTGTMDYWPNADAVAWFVREAMPLLRRLPVPPSFYIVGANPGRAVRQLAAEFQDVTVTGRVPDTRPFILHADVVVAPLRIARGIQNKVLEAMAMGRPVVASPQAFEGVRAEPGRHLLVAEGPRATASAIADVLAGGHPRLGAAARAIIELCYDWSATLSGLDRLFTCSPAPPGGRRDQSSHSGAMLK